MPWCFLAVLVSRHDVRHLLLRFVAIVAMVSPATAVADVTCDNDAGTNGAGSGMGFDAGGGGTARKLCPVGKLTLEHVSAQLSDASVETCRLCHPEPQREHRLLIRWRGMGLVDVCGRVLAGAGWAGLLGGVYSY